MTGPPAIIVGGPLIGRFADRSACRRCFCSGENLFPCEELQQPLPRRRHRRRVQALNRPRSTGRLAGRAETLEAGSLILSPVISRASSTLSRAPSPFYDCRSLRINRRKPFGRRRQCAERARGIAGREATLWAQLSFLRSLGIYSFARSTAARPRNASPRPRGVFPPAASPWPPIAALPV